MQHQAAEQRLGRAKREAEGRQLELTQLQVRALPNARAAAPCTKHQGAAAASDERCPLWHIHAHTRTRAHAHAHARTQGAKVQLSADLATARATAGVLERALLASEAAAAAAQGQLEQLKANTSSLKQTNTELHVRLRRAQQCCALCGTSSRQVCAAARPLLPCSSPTMPASVCASKPRPRAPPQLQLQQATAQVHSLQALLEQTSAALVASQARLKATHSTPSAAGEEVAQLKVGCGAVSQGGACELALLQSLCRPRAAGAAAAVLHDAGT
jgi:hypothetical protein